MILSSSFRIIRFRHVSPPFQAIRGVILTLTAGDFLIIQEPLQT
jgi:hypothetical protein